MDIYKQIQEREVWSYALTNKRIIASRRYQQGVEVIEYNSIKDIVVLEDGDIVFCTDNWHYSLSRVFTCSEEEVLVVKKELEEIRPLIKAEYEKAQKEKRFVSPADEIRKFKQLWDDGIITEEEFIDRKNELLKFKYMD
ncbi:SHOCT domain-containing protein [Ihubacter sp. rT4E-8]|uniref:SHOCT domain-containing protein n=1 Tax=Ihubacter sp. rT4E-8 TaxID=3242369 RepID=UPI003CE8C6C5